MYVYGACVWQSSLTYGILLNYSLPHVLGQGLPLNLELLGSDDLISQLAPVILIATLHMLELQASCYAHLGFTCVLGI